MPVVVLFFVVGAPPRFLGDAGRAWAGETKPDRTARQSFDNAETHYRAGRFAEALVDYEAGYAATPLPGFLVNIAQCQRRLGDLKKARATYQKFLLVAPDSPLGPEVKALVGDLDRALAEMEAANSAGPAAARAEAARAEVKDSPAEGPPPIGLPAATSPTATTAPSLIAAAAPTRPDDKPAPPARAADSGTRWWLWGTLAAVAVGGAVGAFVFWPVDSETLHEGSLGTLRR